MKSRIVSVALATIAFVAASSASAAVTIGSVTPGTNPYTGPTPTYTFDPGSQPGINGGQVETGSVPSAAQPYGSTGDFYAAGVGYSPGVLDLSADPNYGNITSLSFIWGSVDSYNTLQFLDSSMNVIGTFTGNDIFNPANGNQIDPNTNPVVTFLLDSTSAANFRYLSLQSPQTNAFEIDNLAINPVPEPATWAMMLLGFGGIGLTMRTRRRSALAQIA